MRVRCRLREARGGRKIADLAAASGVPRATLNHIENGRQLPKRDQVEAIERAYGVTLAEMFDWYGPLLVVDMDESETGGAAAA